MWSGIAWAAKGISLRRGRRGGPRVEQLEDAMAAGREAPADTSSVAEPEPKPDVETAVRHDRVV
jgi:hypothetical protein